MDLHRIENFTGGWFAGNFSPTLLKTEHFETCVKWFAMGDSEPSHFQVTATEITVVIEGRCLIGSVELVKGDIAVIHPGEVADFVALSDGALVALKSPSLPTDKVLA